MFHTPAHKQVHEQPIGHSLPPVLQDAIAPLVAKPAAFISFADGRFRHLKSSDVPSQVQEAILACDATNTEANLLDESFAIVARVKRVPSAMNGFVVDRA